MSDDPLAALMGASWIAVNPYAAATDGGQTITLDGQPRADYTPEDTIAYMYHWEDDPDMSGLFYGVRAKLPIPPDVVSALLGALNARGRGVWLRVARLPTERHVLLQWDESGQFIREIPRRCTCGRSADVSVASGAV